MSTFEIIPKATWVVIKLYAGQYSSSDIIKVLRWDNMRPELFLKWQWYFKYRAALLQVQHPKQLVTYNSGVIEPTGKTAEQMHNQLISRKKANITKNKNILCSAENKAEEAKKFWWSMLPIEEDKDFKELIDFINKKKKYIRELEKELEILLEKN